MQRRYVEPKVNFDYDNKGRLHRIAVCLEMREEVDVFECRLPRQQYRCHVYRTMQEFLHLVLRSGLSKVPILLVDVERTTRNHGDEVVYSSRLEQGRWNVLPGASRTLIANLIFGG